MSWWKLGVHVVAAIGILLALWGSAIQAHRSLLKAEKVRRVPSPELPADSIPLKRGGLKFKRNGLKLERMQNDLDLDERAFEQEHFRKVAGAWILIIVASGIAFVAEIVNLIIDVQGG